MYLLGFHDKNRYSNASYCYLMRTQAVLLNPINAKIGNIFQCRQNYTKLHKNRSKLRKSNALGSIVGFSQYTANFIYVYIYCMSRGRHVSVSLILGHLQVH